MRPLGGPAGKAKGRGVSRVTWGLLGLLAIVLGVLVWSNRLYVNRGIGFSVVPIRINCPPELTYFSLRRP